jgi:hypothetical protein
MPIHGPNATADMQDLPLDWKILELPKVVPAVHFGMKFVVPLPPTCAINPTGQQRTPSNTAASCMCFIAMLLSAWIG